MPYVIHALDRSDAGDLRARGTRKSGPPPEESILGRGAIVFFV